MSVKAQYEKDMTLKSALPDYLLYPLTSIRIIILDRLHSPPRPQALPAAALAFPSAGQTSGTSGELPLLPLTHCFAWVPSDIVQQVERDQLKPEHLVKLRNPESSVSKEPSQPTHLAVGPGGVLVGAEESSDTCTSAFVKTIPNIAALTQIWLVYIAIRVRAKGNLTINEALLVYLEHLIECNHLYQWRAIADYCHGPKCTDSMKAVGLYGRSTGTKGRVAEEDHHSRSKDGRAEARGLAGTSSRHGRGAASMETMNMEDQARMQGGPSTATRRTELKEHTDGYHSGAREIRAKGIITGQREGAVYRRLASRS
ncbi:uncharacterized protein UDID_17911 [Ustilago sp. UG-2017a]|nr:uncharacterized protein UDID_17911 [Ustilago sp. UG-2017a]